MKKILSLLLMFVMVLSLFPAIASADADSVKTEANVALGKQVWASHSYGNGSLRPEAIVDGNIMSEWCGSHNVYFDVFDNLIGVDENGKEFVIVDLGRLYEISMIKAYARQGADHSYTRGGWLMYASETFDFRGLAPLGEASLPGKWGTDSINYTLKFGSEELFARYIKITCGPTQVISEIEVNGKPSTGKTFKGFTDIDQDKYADELALNTKFSLVAPATFDTLGANYFVSNEDAASIILKLFYPNDEIPEEDCIREAVRRGLLTNYNEYDTSGYIKAQDFLAMIVCGLGYGEYISTIGQVGGSVGTSAHYVAQRLGLTDNVTPMNDFMTREQMLKFVYTAMNTAMYDIAGVKYANGTEMYKDFRQKGTLLEEVYGMEMRYGVITENAVSSLLAPADNRKELVKISGTEYNDKTGTLTPKLGYNVKFLINKDTNDIVYAWDDTKHGKRVKIAAKDVYSYAPSALKVYNENNKIVKYNLQLKHFVVKNGVAYSGYTASSFKPVNGYLEIIDTDGDGRYDVVKIFEPKVVVTEFFKLEDADTYPKYSITNAIDNVKTVYNSYKLIYTISEGLATNPGEMFSSPLFYIYESADGNYLQIEGINKVIEETVISGSDKTEAYLTEGDYPLSKDWQNNAGSRPLIAGGKTYRVILDNFGEIVWLEEIEVVYDLAVILRIVDKSDEISDNVKIQMYTSRGEFITLTTAEKIRVDGKSYRGSAFRDTFIKNTTVKESLYGEPVKYRKNADGLITYMDTPLSQGVYEDGSMVKSTAFDSSTGSLRRYGGFIFAEGSKKQFGYAPNGIPVIVVPFDSATKLPADYEDFTYAYEVSNSQSKIQLADGDRMSAYGTDNFGVSDLFVYKPFVKKNEYKFPIVTNYDSAKILVTNVSKALNANGEPCYRIEGFNLVGGAAIDKLTKPDVTHLIANEKRFLSDCSSYINGQAGKGKTNTINQSKLTDAAWVLFEELKKSVDVIAPGDIVSAEFINDEISAMQLIITKQEILGSYFTRGYKEAADSMAAGQMFFNGTMVDMDANKTYYRFETFEGEYTINGRETTFGYVFDESGRELVVRKTAATNLVTEIDYNGTKPTRVLWMTSHGSSAAFVVFK